MRFCSRDTRHLYRIIPHAQTQLPCKYLAHTPFQRTIANKPKNRPLHFRGSASRPRSLEELLRAGWDAYEARVNNEQEQLFAQAVRAESQLSSRDTGEQRRALDRIYADLVLSEAQKRCGTAARIRLGVSHPGRYTAVALHAHECQIIYALESIDGIS